MASERISSFQDHIMTKILLSDNIIRALADDRPDFFDENKKYDICDEMLKEYNYVQEDGNLRNVISDGCINRFALKYDRILPFLYDNDTITKQSSFIFFDVAYDKTSRFVQRSNNKLVIPYEIYINIYVHNNLVVTSYSKSRSVFIAEEIEDLLLNNTIGRGKNTSLQNVEMVYNRPQALMNGRIHGRNMLFTTIGLEGCEDVV